MHRSTTRSSHVGTLAGAGGQGTSNFGCRPRSASWSAAPNANSSQTLLGRHVARRSGARRVGLILGLHRVREPEVGDPRSPPTARQQHVRGLEVRVHHPQRVRCRQTPASFDEHANDLQPPVRAGQPRRERLPLDELHRDERRPDPREHAGVVDRDDVGVVEAGQHSRLRQHRLRRSAARTFRTPQHLQRDRALQDRVVCPHHQPHPAGAEQAFHLVARIGLAAVAQQLCDQFLARRAVRQVIDQRGLALHPAIDEGRERVVARARLAIGSGVHRDDPRYSM